CLQALEFPWTF
nr:immunoglobulin light chain junction region [Macaca mulatta]MOV85545.1 immunoglobulin light chain junction region [Macaca mulatta]MOV86203.1 immunoglobulin light chain junction region [Macaca mulatta]MOW40792.1 immunoglobulin light chain junction region [Macaca mulatta]MOW40811.1 immunoglobulin light chain junction region [Macaca mulatta]